MKWKRIEAAILLSLIGVVVALTSAGCHKSQQDQRIQNNEVTLNSGANPKTLDPGLVEDTTSARAVSAFMRGLTYVEPDGSPYPDLAERWEVSPDGKTYDIYIRHSLWTNGEPVTADDFVHAWVHRMLNPAFGSTYSYMLYYIEGAEAYYKAKDKDPSKVGVVAVAPNHLRVKLTAPAPFFPQVLSHHSYYPVCVAADKANPKWALRVETYVSNGPFKMVSYEAGDKLVGVKFDGYWNAANVTMNKLTFRFIEEESTELIAFENHDVDGTYQAPRPDLDRLRSKGTLKNVDLIGTYYLNLNMGRPIFSDIRVRKALNLGIDRASIVKNVTLAGEKPAMSLVPPQLYKVPVKEYFKDGDFAEAKRLLAEAGYPDGKGFPPLRYIYNTNENHKAIAQVIQESWKKNLGIELNLDNQEFRVVIDKRHEGDFDLARNGWIADFADPLNFLDLLLSYSGNNDCHWADKQYDGLVEQARDEADAPKRLALLRQAEDYLMGVLPIIPIYFYTQPYLCDPKLDGYVDSPLQTIDVTRIRWKPSAK